jgi:transcriptional regulator with XRE-family HTH domain
MNWLEEHKKQAMENTEFKMEYENLEFEFQVRSILVETRKEAGITQSEVGEMMDTKQSAVSRWEKHPEQMTLKNLKEYADAVGAKIHITLEREEKAGK